MDEIIEEGPRKRTQEELVKTVTVARDSVWVVNDEIQKKTQSGQLTPERKGNIERNVAHLELIMSDPEIVACGEDLSDLQAAIVAGKAALEE